MSLTGRETQNWLAGEQPAGAAYLAGERVIVRNSEPARTGTVLLLTELEPEPRYLIEIGRGHYVQARQSDLMRSA
ncbi:MAG TPA: hypothetical protein VFY81_14525 [Gammaproteobacteria bacterium]|nr:hypothetical protein [Gammaproteobacteria bacterium]